MNILIILSYGAFIWILHYLSDYISLKFIKYKDKILSFAAGISITYLFLELLPQIHEENIEKLRTISYVSIIIVFSIFHLLEKYVYQHSNKEELFERLKHIHTFGFFVYYLIIGAVLYYLMESSLKAGTLFLIPILFHSTISSASSKELHEDIKVNKYIRITVSSSTIIGILIAYYIGVTQSVYYGILGFVIGALFYIIIKDILPEQKEGDPKYFLVGMALFIILLIMI